MRESERERDFLVSCVIITAKPIKQRKWGMASVSKLFSFFIPLFNWFDSIEGTIVVLYLEKMIIQMFSKSIAHLTHQHISSHLSDDVQKCATVDHMSDISSINKQTNQSSMASVKIFYQKKGTRWICWHTHYVVVIIIIYQIIKLNKCRKDVKKTLSTLRQKERFFRCENISTQMLLKVEGKREQVRMNVDIHIDFSFVLDSSFSRFLLVALFFAFTKTLVEISFFSLLRKRRRRRNGWFSSLRQNFNSHIDTHIHI